MEKTIKYLENGEYHYATVRSVGDLAQLKTDSKETLVEAINELWNGGGNVDPSKVPKPEGYDQLVQDIADVVKNQQEISQQWIEWQNEEAQLTEERKQAYLQAMKEMQEAIDKAKADAAALDDKTTKLDEQITKTFSDLDTSIQNMHEQLQKEADRMNQELQDTKGTLSTLRTDLQNTQMDNGRIHDELTNINGKFEHKVWQTDLDPLKEQIDRAETSVQQTKDELLGKASRQDLDTVTNTVSKLDTQLKENAKGIEISVKKDELGGEIAEALTDKTNILLGTRRFTTNNWQQREHVEICSDPWKGFLVAKQNSPIEGIQQAYDVKAGTTYTFSLFAKMDTLDDSNKPQIILAKDNIDTSLDAKIDVWRKDIEDINSDFKRYDLTFTPSEDCTIYPHIISNSNNPIFVCGYQLEIGKTSTPWEPNQEDVGDYVEKSEAQFNVYNDKIQALTEKQRQQGDTQEKLRTEVTQTAEGVKQVSESLKDTNGDITKLRGDLERTADHMKSEYETYTNKAVGQISDSTLNLIRNSSFQNKDEDFAQWQNVSTKANVRQDENGLCWVELTQSGLTTDNPQGLTSNYFNVKQGKVTVAVDIKSGDKATLDNESVLFLELYNDAKKRVDFRFVTLSELGLSKNLLDDHKVHRGLYRLGIDRNDAQYMTVKAHLIRNGDLYFTNFSARLSSIDDGAYEPNPDDINQQILKQNTKIEQNAKEVAIKANSVDVTRDIKSAVQNSNGGGVNLLRGTSPEWKTLTGGGWFTQTTSTGTIEIGSLVPGDTVTYTITVRNNSQYAVYPEIIGYSDGPGTRTFGVKKDEGVQPGETKTVSMSAAIAENTINIDAWVATNDPSAPTFSVDAKNEKLEKGSVAPPWTPAYEDTSAEIKSAKDAAIKVASDKIEIKANELKTTYEETLKTKINEVKTASEKFTSDGIEQVVTKVTNVKNDVDRLGDTVNGIQIGGRNMVTGTENDIIIDDTSNTGSQGWCFTRLYLTQQPKVGDQLTISAESTLTGRGRLDDYTVVLYNDTTSDQRSSQGRLRPGQRSSVTITVDNMNGNGNTVLLIYSGNPSDTQGKKNVVHHLKVEKGNKATDWTPAPEDINQSIKDATEYKAVTGTIDFNNLKTQQKIFYKDLQAANAPAGSNYWYYLDVERGYDGRILQTAVSDRDNITWVRTFVDSWSPWIKQADQRNVDDLHNQINGFKTETTASVKNLGDRVTTEVNSITTRQNNFENEAKEQHSNDVELVRKSDFEDGSKGSWTVTGVVPATNPAPPAELGQSGMKVLQTNTRDAYEDGIWYSVKPGEKFDVDFWCAPSFAFHTEFGLCFADKNKENWNWQGIQTDQSGQWKHYTGTIAAPTNAAFARPWYQMDKPANNTTNSSWIAKPHIRRQNPQVAEKISELNTKWDVANGQIQGKVTATDVNNIINGKGYATQSWAQTMFQMKSDAITLQAVRNNITNGIQNQVNNIDNRVTNAQIGERNLAVGTNRGKAGWWVDPGNGTASTDIALLNGVKGLHINNTKKSTSWWVVCYPFDMGKLKPNTYYTISFDIQTSENTNGGAIIDLARGDSSGSPFIEGRGGNITTKGGEITHVTRTLKTGGGIENNGQALYINSIALGGSNVVNIANLMIVEGTQSPVWKPAPEDQGSGQNLLRGTADFSWPAGIGFNGDFNTSFERFDDTSVAFHLWGSKGGGIYTQWGGAFPDGQLQVGEQYTFSFDIKGSGKFSTVRNESEPEKPPITLNGVNVPSEWARVSVTGTIQALDQAFIIYFRDNFDVRIKNVKIERGAIATPWTPHPFDDKDKGVNLLKSTAYWNPNDWNHLSDGKWYDDNWTDNLGHKAYGRSNSAWDGLGQTVYVTQGVYTWSAQIYLNGLDSNDSVYPYMGDGQYNGTAQVQDIRKPMLGVNDQNRWIDYSTTFYVKNAGNLCVRPELNRDHGNIHVGSQKLEHGMVATPWSPSPYDSDPKNIVSAINITPDQIKIASNKIVIDGNTDIHGDLRTDRVRLVGKNGAIDMTGDTGIKLTNNDGSSMLLGRGNVDLMYKNDFRMNIDSSLMTIMQRNQFTDQNKPIAILNIGASWNHSYEKIRGADIRYNPGNVNDVNLHGADYLALSYNKPNLTPGEANIKPQLVMAYQDLKFDENHYLWRKGVNVADDLTIQEYQRINVGYRDKEDQNGKWTNDPLMIHRMQWSNSYQADRYQPTIRLGYGPNSYGHAGVTFLWDQVKPFGDRDISDLGSIWFNGLRFSFGWVHNNRMMGGQNQPAFMRFDDKGGITSGIAFAPGSTWDLGTGAWNITASVMNHGG